MKKCPKCESADLVERTGKIAIDGIQPFVRYICKCGFVSETIIGKKKIPKDFGFDKEGKIK